MLSLHPPATFTTSLRTALMQYAVAVGNNLDGFTRDDAAPVLRAWIAGTAEVMARACEHENRARGWLAKAAVGAFDGQPVPGILLDNPYAVQFLETQGGELIKGINQVTRETIRAFVQQGLEDHLTTAQTARLIRSVLPLTPQQWSAVNHMMETQLAANVPDDRVMDLAEKFAGRMVAVRANVIARTETIRASAAGLQASWDSAVQRGLLSKNAQQVWIGGGSARTCEICSALIGKTAALGKAFSGGVDRPPAHPSCRCTLGIAVT